MISASGVFLPSPSTVFLIKKAEPPKTMTMIAINITTVPGNISASLSHPCGDQKIGISELNIIRIINGAAKNLT